MRIKNTTTTRAQKLARIVELATADLVTAEQLAQDLGCNERTIYRYVGRLRDKGVPIRGEAGMGYQIKKEPPFNLGIEVSKLIMKHFPGVEDAEPHAVAAVADGLGEAFAGVLSVVTVARGLDAVSEVIERNTRAIQINVEQMLNKALAPFEGMPEGVKGRQ